MAHCMGNVKLHPVLAPIIPVSMQMAAPIAAARNRSPAALGTKRGLPSMMTANVEMGATVRTWEQSMVLSG